MIRRVFQIILAGWLLGGIAFASGRFNQEGRLLGPLPVVTNSILFNTTNADAVVSAMQIFPVTNPWNEDISRRPVLTNSDTMLARIITDLGAGRSNLTPEFEMNFVLVPDNQPHVPFDFGVSADESDLDGGSGTVGLYPIPTNLPIETWPVGTGSQTLAQWQTNNNGDDRHAIIVEPGSGFIWESWMTYLSGTTWNAANGAMFNLNTNGFRTPGWTSGDAAGFPMFPALVRFDEAERGMVEHACRLVVKKSFYHSYIYPANHFAAPSGNTDFNLPKMGQRLRLKSGFVIPANWTKEEKAVLLGLKKYGAMVADNGNFFSFSVTPDNRWPANCFNHLTSVTITNFEVIVTTSTNEGPRSPDAPTASAGANQSGATGVALPLAGAVNFTGAAPAILWQVYSGPGTVTFGDATQASTTATFSAPGIYFLRLSAADGVHAVAYDGATFVIGQPIVITATRTGTNLNLSWTGGAPPYSVQQTETLPTGAWNTVLTTSNQTASVAITSSNNFFRVVGQ